MNLKKLFFQVVTLSMAFATQWALAEEATGGSARGQYDSLAAAIAISVAAFGGALAQGRTAAAALEGIARNPAADKKIFTPMIIGLALIESLVLYAFVIAFVKT